MSQTVDILTAAYSILIFSIAFLGNMTTVIIIPLFKSLQSTTNFYILNLAIADLLICVTTIPSRMVFLFKSSFLTCKITTFMWIFFFNASVFAIYFIAIDRYVFICKPLYYRSNFITTRTKYWIGLSWVVAFLLAILPFINIPYITVQDYSEQKAICVHKAFVGGGYLVFLIILTEVTPPFIFCLLYGKIITVARKHAFQIAIQFTSSNQMAFMNWQKGRRCTEPLVSPFEDPSCLLQLEATDEEIKQLKRILFKNNDCWGQDASKETLQIAPEECNIPSCSKEEGQRAEKLSDVGINMREWKRRAKRSAERAAMEDKEQTERGVGQESDGHKKPGNLKVVVSAQSDEPVSHISWSITDHSRPNSRPQYGRSISDGIVHRLKGNGRAKQSKERPNKYGNFKARNRVRPFVTRTLSRFSTSAQNKDNERPGRHSGRLKIYKEFKAVKMLGMVVGMFILLHLPIAVIDLIGFCGQSAVVPGWFVKFALLLTQTAPAANTMIYVATKREFRYAFVRLWSCGRIKKRLAQL